MTGPYRRLVRVTPEGATDVSWNSIPSDVQAQMHELNDQIPAPSGKGHVEVPAGKGHMETAYGQQDTERESPDDVLQNSQPIDARTRGPQ